ncbi:MAG: hypothetical protein AB7I50_00880 [Vicinamibacterales bacterium]
MSGRTVNRLAGFFVACVLAMPLQVALDAQPSGPSRIGAAPPSLVRGQGEVVLTYQLAAPAQTVAIEIASSTGEVVRRWGNGSAEDELERAAGAHQLGWNLRTGDASIFRAPGDERPTVIPGPVVAPGTYGVRLLIDGRVAASASIVVRHDPAGARESDISAHVAFARQLALRTTTVTAMVDDLRAAKRDVTARIKNARSPVIGLAGDVVLRKLTEVEVGLAEPALRVPVAVPAPEKTLSVRLDVLVTENGANEQPPSPVARAALNALDSEIDTQVQRLGSVVTNEIEAFNNLLTNAMMEPIRVPRVPARATNK